MLPPQPDTHHFLKRETLFQGYFRIDRFHLQHELFEGGTSPPYTREVLQRGKCALVLLFDPQKDKVILVEQFRVGPLAAGDHPWMLELVAGVIESGEDASTTASREAAEEAGCRVTELHPIFSYYNSPGSSSEFSTLFIGRVEAPENSTIHGLFHENENIRAHSLEATKAISLLYGGKLRDSSTIIALQWFAMHHTELRSKWLVRNSSQSFI